MATPIERYAAYWWSENTGEADPWELLDAEEREAVIDASYARVVADWLASERSDTRECGYMGCHRAPCEERCAGIPQGHIDCDCPDGRYDLHVEGGCSWTKEGE